MSATAAGRRRHASRQVDLSHNGCVSSLGRGGLPSPVHVWAASCRESTLSVGCVMQGIRYLSRGRWVEPATYTGLDSERHSGNRRGNPTEVGPPDIHRHSETVDAWAPIDLPGPEELKAEARGIHRSGLTASPCPLDPWAHHRWEVKGLHRSGLTASTGGVHVGARGTSRRARARCKLIGMKGIPFKLKKAASRSGAVCSSGSGRRHCGLNPRTSKPPLVPRFGQRDAHPLWENRMACPEHRWIFAMLLGP